MRYNILFGGAAGTGPNILTHILREALVKQGYFVFYSRDYQSLIRGGHNFNVLTFSDKPVYSNDKKIDILIALDKNTENIHKAELEKEGIILNGKKENMYFAGALFKILGLDFKILEAELKDLKKRFEENLENSKKGYEEEKRTVKIISSQKNKAYFANGNQGISQGAIKSGLDIYYAYPMTPATSVLGELAEEQVKNNFLVLELENEIAVINSAIGSAITGAKSMVGTSGGGFDLMTEGLSLTGIAEVPLVIFLSQRPGPGTGVATYTAQGDLNIARHSGHGEFQRVVLAPGNPKEAEELTNQAFYFSQKYKVPSIIVSDKHLGESFYTLTEKANIVESKKSVAFSRFNSYEKDREGSSTENPEIIKKNIEARESKNKEIEKEAKKFEQYKIYGNRLEASPKLRNSGRQNSKNIVVGWGSTSGAILDSINELDCKFLQVLYIEPFPKEIEKELENKNIILIENNSTGQLGNLIREKTGIEIKNKILRYDGRAFLCDELREEIRRKLR